MYDTVFQVLQDLLSYKSKAQSSYNPPPGPLPPGPPVRPPAPAGPGAPGPGAPGPPAPRLRRKRSARAIGLPVFRWFPYFTGGTNSDEVFAVNI